MKTTLNWLCALLLPLTLIFNNYISITYDNFISNIFLTVMILIMIGLLFVSGKAQELFSFLKSSKREIKYITWIKKDDAINKMLKYLVIIIVMGLIIAFMDELISRFISFTLL